MSQYKDNDCYNNELLKSFRLNEFITSEGKLIGSLQQIRRLLEKWLGILAIFMKV